MFSIEFLNSRPFLAICGSSGVGKTTLTRALVQRGNFERPTSFTTRKKREGEDSDEYHFLSRTDFFQRLGVDFFFYDEVFGNVYAIEATSVEELYSRRSLPTKELAIQNIDKLHNKLGCLPMVVFLRGHPEQRDGRVETRAEKSDQHISIEFDPRLSKQDALPSLVSAWVRALELHHMHFGRTSLENLAKEERKNLIGYNIAAPYFNDNLRITTRSFHLISEDFWSTLIPALHGSVLEIGPGHGWLRRNFDWEAKEYHGIELSSRMREFNGEPSLISVGSLQRHDRIDGSYDAIVGSLIDPCLSPTNLVHSARLLKSGGTFAGTVPSKEWANHLRQERGYAKDETEFSTPDGPARVTSYCYGEKEIAGLLEAVGFGDIEIRPLGIETLRSTEKLPPDIALVTEQVGESTPIMYAWSCKNGASLRKFC